MNKNYEEIEELKGYDVNVAKDRLIEVMYKLDDLGAKREAKSLGTIIEKPEAWQNK